MVDKVCLQLVIVLALFGGQGMTQAETGEYNVRHLAIESLQDSKPSYSEALIRRGCSSFKGQKCILNYPCCALAWGKNNVITIAVLYYYSETPRS